MNDDDTSFVIDYYNRMRDYSTELIKKYNNDNYTDRGFVLGRAMYLDYLQKEDTPYKIFVLYSKINKTPKINHNYFNKGYNKAKEHIEQI